MKLPNIKGYIVTTDLPPDDKKSLDNFMIGQTRPIVEKEGENKHECVFYCDYETWYNNTYSKDIEIAQMIDEYLSVKETPDDKYKEFPKKPHAFSSIAHYDRYEKNVMEVVRHNTAIENKILFKEYRKEEILRLIVKQMPVNEWVLFSLDIGDYYVAIKGSNWGHLEGKLITREKGEELELLK